MTSDYTTRLTQERLARATEFLFDLPKLPPNVGNAKLTFFYDDGASLELCFEQHINPRQWWKRLLGVR